MPHDGRAEAARVGRLAQGNVWLGVRVETAVTPAADAWISSIDTVSNSESGFERVHQGSCLLLSVPIALSPGHATGLRVRHSVVVDPAAVAERWTA
jgi:hypothetical protein